MATAFSATPPARQRFGMLRALPQRVRRGGGTPPRASPAATRRRPRRRSVISPSGSRAGPKQLDELLGVDAADRRRAGVPGHVDAFLVVREVVEVELEQRPVELHELAHLREVPRRPVRREAHHLALVAVVRKAEPLRDGGVEDAERVRVDDALEHVEVVAVALREHRRREVAEAVDREDGRVLERRDEERRRDVRLVMLDVVHRARRIRSTPSASASAEPTSRICAAFCRRCFRYRADAPWRIVRMSFRPRLARGSRETATWSRSAGVRPASSRHQRAASAGKPAQCLTRLKRSSSAAATSSPSTTSAAAASP